MLAAPRIDAIADAARTFLSRIDGPGPLLVAVSGGGDSMALLLALREAAGHAERQNSAIVAATVDHRLRAASGDEACWVASACAGYGIAHRILTWDGEKPSSGIQSEARLARYRLLADEARRVGAVGIVTAHTLDDQAETVAMRAGRSDPDAFTPGLAGMADATLFARSTWILRPFLGVRRAHLRQWLADRGQGWLDDPSNEDRRFERVRTRGRLAGGADAEAIQAAQDARRRLSDATAAVIADHVTILGDSVARVRLDGSFPSGSAARMAIETIVALIGGGGRRSPHETAERLAAFVAGGGLSRMTAGRAVVDRRADGLYIYRERRSLTRACIRPGETIVWDRRYRIENRSGTALTVAPAGAEEIARLGNLLVFRDVPPGVVKRAVGAQPMLSRGAGRDTASLVFGALPDGVTVTRHFALFDVFLPDFDLKLANRCMETFGQLGYGLPPVGPT